MKIVDFDSYKKAINKLESMTSEQQKPLIVFPPKTEKSTSERLQKFFEIADGGNPEWNV